MVETDQKNPRYDFDAVVVGAGMGGIYAAHRLSSLGLRVLGLEGASGVGGVWFHNRYPGARVDVESQAYNFLFDKELTASWNWSERYAGQPELCAYLNFVADHLDVRKLFRFDSLVTGAKWDGALQTYTVTINNAETVATRFLIMATGQLSKPRTPEFEGLENFGGQWVRTGDWPAETVELEGKRVAVIGTGSSGVQAITEIATKAAHLHVFQRTPSYTVPNRNRPSGPAQTREVVENFDAYRDELLGQAAGVRADPPAGPVAEHSPDRQRELIAQRWDEGGATINFVFADQGVNPEANNVVSEFVRGKIAEIVTDPAVAEKLTPRSYPIGTRRVCVSTGYYETFNRENVTLVDVRDEPIVRLTERGIKTIESEYEFDVVVFALGFDAFTGALNDAQITNTSGAGPTDHWNNGPSTYLGLMTGGFPNLFMLTGPGSPSVLANMFLTNTQHVDLVAEIISHMNERGYTTAEPTDDAVREWTQHAKDVAEPMLRRQVESYMVQIGEDGYRYLIPYAGGLHNYIDHCDKVVADGFSGVDFR